MRKKNLALVGLALAAACSALGCGGDCAQTHTSAVYGVVRCHNPVAADGGAGGSGGAGGGGAGGGAGGESLGTPVCRDPSVWSEYQFFDVGSYADVMMRSCTQTCAMILRDVVSIDGCQPPRDDGNGNIIVTCDYTERTCTSPPGLPQ